MSLFIKISKTLAISLPLLHDIDDSRYLTDYEARHSKTDMDISKNHLEVVTKADQEVPAQTSRQKYVKDCIQ